MLKSILKTTILLLISYTGIAQSFSKNEQATTYFLIRHAEKYTNDLTDKNPSLTEQGNIRANNWVKVFSDIKVDYIFSTEYKRTQQTANPIAKSKNLPVTNYNPGNLYTPKFKEQTKGKTSIIIGHSNTIPAFINELIHQKKYNIIDEKEYGKLFIVTISGSTISENVLTIN